MAISEPGDEVGASAAAEEPPRVERLPPRASDTILVLVAGATAIVVTLAATAVLLARDEPSSWGWWVVIAVSGGLALSALGLGGILVSRRRAFLGETRLLLVELDESASIERRQPGLAREAVERREALIMSGDFEMAERLREALHRAGVVSAGAARPRHPRGESDWADGG